MGTNLMLIFMWIQLIIGFVVMFITSPIVASSPCIICGLCMGLVVINERMGRMERRNQIERDDPFGDGADRDDEYHIMGADDMMKRMSIRRFDS